MKTVISLMFYLLILLSSNTLKAQVSVGLGGGLHLNQSYKNIANAGNHSFIYSEALNINGKIGFKKNNYEFILRVDYANIPQRIIFKFPFFDLPQFSFSRKTISPSLNVLFAPKDKFILQAGIGILYSEYWTFHEEISEFTEFLFDPLFTESTNSPYISLGCIQRIKLNKNFELRPSIHFRVGFKSLNSSFQSMDLNIANGTTLIIDDFYLNKGSALIIDLNLVYLFIK